MWIKLFLLTTLIPMIIGDLKRRSISVLWLAGFIANAVLIRFYKCEFSVAFLCLGINIIILSFMFLGALSYFMIKYKAGHKRFIKSVGLGDIIFLYALTLLFEPESFIVFLILSLLFSLVWYGFSVMISGSKKTIPLVATIALCYLFYSCIKLAGYGI